MWGILVAIKILLCFHASFCEDADKKGLKSVIVLYRHGDRSPIRSFPKDEYYNEKYWPMGFGELTNKGKLRHYNLGKWLRNTYKDFLPKNYNPNDIYVYSTDLDRTLMSAAANLAGLYPPNDYQTRDDVLHWQPIPVHSTPMTNNSILQAEVGCPKHTKLLELVQRSEFYKSINERYLDLYDQISSYTGWKVDDVAYLENLFSVVYAYSTHNASYVPIWYDRLDLDVLEFLASLNLMKYTFTPELAKLRNGIFLYKLLEHFNTTITKKETSSKLLMYSAHDTTLVWILHGLNMYDYRIPKFASMIVWELYERDHRLYVNLLYKYNETYTKKLVLDGCSFDCDYSTFVRIMTPLILHPDERDAACAVHN